MLMKFGFAIVIGLRYVHVHSKYDKSFLTLRNGSKRDVNKVWANSFQILTKMTVIKFA